MHEEHTVHIHEVFDAFYLSHVKTLLSLFVGTSCCPASQTAPNIKDQTGREGNCLCPASTGHGSGACLTQNLTGIVLQKQIVTSNRSELVETLGEGVI